MASQEDDSTRRKRQGAFVANSSRSLDEHGFPILPKRKTHSERLDSHHEPEDEDTKESAVCGATFKTFS